MKLKVEEAHSVQTKNGVSRCIKCKKIEPSLQQRCPKRTSILEPVTTRKK